MSVGTPYISGLNFIFERLFVNVNAINLNEKSFPFTFYDSVNLPKNINSLQNKKNKKLFLLKFTLNSARARHLHCIPVWVNFVIAPNVGDSLRYF